MTPAALENPAGSYYWCIDEVAQLQAPDWGNYEYKACGHLAAKCKQQLIKANAVEFQAGGFYRHSPDEWRPGALHKVGFI